MKYLILNHINGNNKALQKILSLPESYDKILILGNIINKKKESLRVLETLYRMVATGICENFTCGLIDVTQEGINYLPEGAKLWMKGFLPVSTFEDCGKKVMLLTGSPNDAYCGIRDDNECRGVYWNNDATFDVIIKGNAGNHCHVERKMHQTIISPGFLFNKETNKLQYSVLEINKKEVKCQYKEIEL